MIVTKVLWVETLLALLQRLIPIFVFVYVFDISLSRLALTGDGDSYLAQARAILSQNFESLMGTADIQFFIGYPLILSFFLLFFPPWAAGYFIQALCLLGVFYFGNKVFKDRWIMRFFIFCLPSMVFFTCLNMSEAWIMVLLLAALCMFLERKWALLGILMAIATITRPQTCFFLYLPIFLWLLYKKEWKALAWLVSLPSLFCVGMFFFCFIATGDPFINMRAYDSASEGGVLQFPLRNLWVSTFNEMIPLWKKIYVWFHVLFVFGGAVFLWRKMCLKRFEAFYVILFGWVVSHTFFYLSVGSWWGFHALPRYLIPVFPAVFFGYGEWIPRKNWVLIILALGCIGVSILSLRL